MARGRMLNNSVSQSLKFNQLPDDTCRLLATWTLAHLDKNGVFYGLAVSVKSLIFPHRADITVEQVEAYLQAMERVGLIHRFTASGILWQWWPTFTDNQVGLRADREFSDFPAPPSAPPSAPTGDAPAAPPAPASNGSVPENCRNDAGKNPAEIRAPSGGLNQNKPPEVEVEVESELIQQQQQYTRTRASPALTALTTNYQDWISLSVNGHFADEFRYYAELVQPDWVDAAYRRAKNQNVRKWAYIKAILDDCITAGRWVDRPANFKEQQNDTNHRDPDEPVSPIVERLSQPGEYRY